MFLQIFYFYFPKKKKKNVGSYYAILEQIVTLFLVKCMRYCYSVSFSCCGNNGNKRVSTHYGRNTHIIDVCDKKHRYPQDIGFRVVITILLILMLHKKQKLSSRIVQEKKTFVYLHNSINLSQYLYNDYLCI